MMRSHEGNTDAAERDFYRRLLDLGGQDELEPLLASALALIVEVTGAAVAYLELSDDDGGEPRFWRGHRLTDAEVTSIRTSISRGIIARTLADGRTLTTASALDDERFAEHGSVQQKAIQAVLCAPIGAPPVGVVYLQGTRRPGGFSNEDRARAELFARQLAPLADRLRARHPGHRRVDYTRETRATFRCPQLVGTSAAMARVLQAAALQAPLDLNVLITGEGGTGKSALARAIADNSKRARGPFVALNCAAIQESLLESELFGAERGAHSTATRAMPGKVAAAEGGTLFLDEISELSTGAQAKLLQLLEERQYYALGSTTAVRADVRFIAATNADLMECVAAKRFRKDLYHRIHVLPIAMPGLAERRDDIPALVEHACAEACRRHDFPPMTIAHSTLLLCREGTWPGNIRELAHAVEAGVVRARGDASLVLLPYHVFPDLAADTTSRPATFHEATRQFQRRYLLELLEANDWNISATARQLDIARAHLYNLVKTLGLRGELPPRT